MRIALLDAGAVWADRPGGARRLAALRALCDTWVPAVRPPAASPPLDGFWSRRASDLDTHRALAGWLATRAAPDEAAEVDRLLDVLAGAGFARLAAAPRAALLAGLGRASAEAAAGIADLRSLTLLLHYGLVDRLGRNPAWPALGYPGPPNAGPGDAEAIASDASRLAAAGAPGLPSGSDVVLEADVCVVGSGAGGAVVAAVLASAGLGVVVLEAGGADGPAVHELDAMRDLYWRGGLTARSDDGNVTLLAGATLGGGTTVNWANCVEPTAAVRAAWASEHGLEGVDGPAFDAHLAAVQVRIGATEACSDRNGPNEVLARGASALGWSWRPARCNADLARYDPAAAGHTGFGDRTGSKQGAVETFLADAVAAGTRLVPRCRAERVVTAGGRAVGVVATVAGRQALEVRAGTVVVAAGALETPALLLRSGIGGPAVGRHLHLHPVVALVGFHDAPQRAWWGPPQSAIVDEHAELAAGYGYLLETPHYGVALSAAALPWRSGRDHKLLLGRLDRAASTIALVRDRGAGQVTVDDRGEAVVTYAVEDPLDRDHLRRGFAAMARVHAAAGARALLDLAPGRALWRRGTDLDGWIARHETAPVGAGARPLFSAHQMSSARMGRDPAASVADPDGRLHDTAGVWVGDTSAFPSAVGVNPMVTCMALARRTAEAVLAARPR